MEEGRNFTRVDGIKAQKHCLPFAQRGLTSVSKYRLIKCGLREPTWSLQSVAHIRECDNPNLIGCKIMEGIGTLPHFRVNLPWEWSVLPETPFKKKSWS